MGGKSFVLSAAAVVRAERNATDHASAAVPVDGLAKAQ